MFVAEISKITTSWSNKEPGGFNDGDVVYGSNGLRIVTTWGKEIWVFMLKRRYSLKI